MNGPDRDTRQYKEKKEQQMKEQPGGRAITPANDWGSQGGKARNPGMEHPGQATASMQPGRPDWIIRGGADRHPGLEHPGMKQVARGSTKRRRTRRRQEQAYIQDRKDQQERAIKRRAADQKPGEAGKGASGPALPEATQEGGEGKGRRTRVQENQGGQRARDQPRRTRSGSTSKATGKEMKAKTREGRREGDGKEAGRPRQGQTGGASGRRILELHPIVNLDEA